MSKKKFGYNTDMYIYDITDMYKCMYMYIYTHTYIYIKKIYIYIYIHIYLPLIIYFLVTPCLLVAVQPCMDWIPIKNIIKWVFFQTGRQFKSSNGIYEVIFFQAGWHSIWHSILCHSIYINYRKCMSHYLIFYKWWLHISYGTCNYPYFIYKINYI